MRYFRGFLSFFIAIVTTLLLTQQVEAALLVSQPTVNSGDNWSVSYNNGHTFEFDMLYESQWPVLTCKSSPSGSVSVWFQGSQIYAKTSSGYSKLLGGTYPPAAQHYKVVCNNDVVGVYVNGGFIGSASDSSINVPSSNFLNNPSVTFVANGFTQMTNFTISDSDANNAPVVTSLTVPSGTQLQDTPIDISANFTDAESFNTHTATISWGDGNTTTGTVAENNGAGSVTGSHAYAIGGDYTIRVTVTDQDGASVYGEEQVHVNLSPSIYLVNASGDSSSTYTGVGSFSDSDSTAWTGTVDYGDGSGTQTLQINNQNSTFALNHNYSANGDYTITVTLTDNQNESSSPFTFSSKLLVTQPTVYSGNNWTVNYNNGQVFDFDMDFVSQWPVLTCKNSPSGGVSVWFQGRDVYAKTSSGFSQLIGNIEPNFTAHYRVVCQNDKISLYVNGNLTGEATDSSINVPSANFVNNPTVTFVANGSTRMTNITIANFLPPQPVTTTFNSIADTYVKSGSDNRNTGAGTFMRLQSSGDNRSLVKFNQIAMQQEIGNKQVLSAKLRVTIVDNGNNWGTTGRTIDVHRLINTWTEGNGTENARGTGVGATWECGADSNIANQSKNCTGSDEWEMGQPNNPAVHPWIQMATDTETITNNQSGVVEFDVTGDVSSFLNNTNQNYGWIIKKTAEGQNGQVSFGTKESPSVPQLIVTYQP